MARKARNNLKADGAADGAATSAGKPKRVRRKCSAPGCINRVVQGGVCVTHGAKRKLCSHPGCSKAVKLAGYCSTHGPARRKCDTTGCTRVAVQGGKCLSHGARRRVCCYPLAVGKKEGERCTKNAIMGGMCKKHYDRVQDAEGMLEMSLCVPVAAGADAAGTTGGESSIASSRSAMSGMEESDEQAGYSLGTAHSWGSQSVATTAAATTVSEAPAPGAAEPMSLSPVNEQAAVGYQPPLHRHHRLPRKLKHHQRGLSIFDEMPTVDAIINSCAENQEQTQVQVQQPSQPQAQPPHQVPSHPQVEAVPQTVPQALPPSVTSVSYDAMSTKTPNTQVSFADCSSLPSSRVAAAPTKSSLRRGSGSEEACTGNSSCTCNACRSPTLAIFEQMIQASQKIERGDVDPEKYASLSPPKLSPRKTSSVLASATSATTTPKNVSWLPLEPSSSGSVVRKVSNNNMVEDVTGPVWTPKDYRESPSNDATTRPGPASHALASMARTDSEESNVSRTVSHDVEERGHHHHYPHVQQYPGQGYEAHPPPHYHYHERRSPPRCDSHHYQAPHGHYPAPQGHYPGAPPPRYHYDPNTPHAFQPPQTPALYDSHEPPISVVSAGSSHQHEHLLPRPRENGRFEHLFIPKEV